MKALKTESVAEFMARGGKITKVAPNVGKRGFARAVRQSLRPEPESVEVVDMSALPEALRIKYGVK